MANVNRFSEKLHEQLGFLQRSCAGFDEGHEPEALRLATTMRVLFHDTWRRDGRPSSISLLSHLSMTNTMMLETPRTNLADWRDFLSIRIDLSSRSPMTLVPRLEKQFQVVPFSAWWSTNAVMTVDEQPITRRKLIVSAVNKDGGAHVDAILERFYQELAAGRYSIGINRDLKYDKALSFEQCFTLYPHNGHLALLRQFAHEVLSPASHFGWN